jgi:hypothetical protein
LPIGEGDMKRKRCIAIAVLVVIIVAIIVSYSVLTRYHVHISEKSPDGTKVAKIVWKRVIPYTEGVEGWLLVEDLEKNTVLIERLLKAGEDIPVDITNEFRGLSWDGNKIVLEVRGTRYKGPLVIEVE